MINEFSTVKEVSSFAKRQIDDYRKYPSHKDDVVDNLRPLFERDAEVWKIVIDGGEFVTTFKKDLGKQRLRYLKKLLYTIDLEWYKSIDFGIE